MYLENQTKPWLRESKSQRLIWEIELLTTLFKIFHRWNNLVFQNRTILDIMYKLGIIEETTQKKMKNTVAEGTVELEESNSETAVWKLIQRMEISYKAEINFQYQVRKISTQKSGN